MPNVVAVVKDDRVRRQIEQYLNELDTGDLRFATFSRVEEFEALYFKDPTKKSEPEPGDPNAAPPPEGSKPPEPSGPEEIELRLFRDVHMVIFALDSVKEKPAAWIDKVRTNLKKYKHWPENGQQRWVLLKYEDDGINKLDLLHPALDDLIYLPLDRLIFLQKMEILLALPSLATPSYLFNQEVKHQIEISKIAKLDRLSDVAMGIRNPVPLVRGLPAKFYVQLPGDKNRLELRGKVIRSDPHPDYPGQYIVYFGFFGLSKSALTQIRRQLSKAPRYQSLKNEDREVVRFDPTNLFLSPEEQAEFNLAIIDPEESAIIPLGQQLTKEMDRLHIIGETSYSIFLYKYFSPAGSLNKSDPPKPTEEADFYNSPLSLSIAVEDLKCLSVDPGPNETDLFLGHQASAIFSSPEGYLSLLQDQSSRLLVEESINLASEGRVMEKLLIMQDSSNVGRAVKMKAYKSSADHIVTVELLPAGLGDIVEQVTQEDTNPTLDLMIVNMSFVSEDPNTWVENLRARAFKLNLVKNPEQLKFLIIADQEPRDLDKWMNAPDILGMFIKPVDSRQMLYFLSEILPNKNTLYTFNNLGWSQPNLSVHVAKKLELEALSEFGATIRSPQKLVPGSTFYLRKSIYDNAPNQCLAARVYHCKEHPDGGYLVYATYFGINDAFLKYARTWIRENYAQQKHKE